MALSMLFKYLRKSDEKPKPGDLIEFLRGLYQHWAVYVGDGYVVHLAVEPNSVVQGAYTKICGSVPTKKAMVKREKLQDVAKENKWIISNRLDRKYKPRSPDAIVRKANDLVGQEWSYDVVTQNCEHFANELRYGKAESLQVHSAANLLIGKRLDMVVGGVDELVEDLWKLQSTN